jgi:hypothetical protein
MTRSDTHPLQACLEDFQTIGRWRHDMVPDMQAIERAAESLREKFPLSFDDLDELFHQAQRYWWFADFWHVPRKDGSLSLSFRLCDLGEKNEKQTIRELFEELRQIELVSIVLRFAKPDAYGILSPPVERVLNVAWGSESVETYLNYLRNLRTVCKVVPFVRVADADMALWVLHAKYFGPWKREVAEYYGTDPTLLRLRAQNLIGPLRELRMSILARAFESVVPDIAKVLSCYLFELAVREKAKAMGAKDYEGRIELWKVIDGVEGKVTADTRSRWKDLKDTRNRLFHQNIKPSEREVQNLLHEIEEIEKGLPDVRLGKSVTL